MRVILSTVIALAAVARYASGGEGGALPPTDLTSILHWMLSEFGLLGAVIAALIWDRKEERKKREDDGKRWYDLDQKLIELVEKTITALTNNTSETTELRQDFSEIKTELRHIQTTLSKYKKSDGDTQ
ncbi:MAG: hypothetical protein LUC93_04715 [Planctomycetaceae bacterium]|nr:hypothetical protein [Planctomycetaceae bacterium]